MSKPPHELTEIANYLKSSDLRQRQGILKGKRVDYFKGKHAVNALLREGYQKSKLATIVKIKNRETAEQVIKDLHIHGFFLKAEKPAKSKFLNLVQEQTFEQESYYFWVYQGAQWKGILIGTGVVLVTFAGVMFPLWPALPRQGVYYLSLALLGFVGFIMLLGVVRAILWLLLKIFLGKSGWLFPNLFADVGFIESFIPLWAWDGEKVSGKKSKKKTVASKAANSDMDEDDD